MRERGREGEGDGVRSILLGVECFLRSPSSEASLSSPQTNIASKSPPPAMLASSPARTTLSPFHGFDFLWMSLKLGILNTRHGLMFKPSLDEQTLELQVKTSIGAEDISQQRLAAAEAEIVDLRQKLEASKREKPGLSDILKSKHEENEAYISKIETIGQAYYDMQAQNQ